MRNKGETLTSVKKKEEENANNSLTRISLEVGIMGAVFSEVAFPLD